MVISNIYIMNITKFEGGDYSTLVMSKISLSIKDKNLKRAQ